MPTPKSRLQPVWDEYCRSEETTLDIGRKALMRNVRPRKRLCLRLVLQPDRPIFSSFCINGRTIYPKIMW